MSRRGFRYLAVVSAFLCISLPADAVHAQESAANSASEEPAPAQAEGNAAIAQRLLQIGKPERCDAPAADGAIVVCSRRGANEKERLPLRGELDSARSTKDGLARAPDVFGIHHAGVTAATGCFLPPCPPPVMPDIDFTALPEAPPDSDADKIARGEIRAP